MAAVATHGLLLSLLPPARLLKHSEFSVISNRVRRQAQAVFSKLMGLLAANEVPPPFSGQEYLSILACDFSSTGLFVLSLRSSSDAMSSCKRLFVLSLVCWAQRLAVISILIVH